MDYKVQFEVFEGPLDLLLYLVKKEEVDIYEVNLTKLATQFLAHVEMMRQLDLEIAGEFLVMAATLMYIKSKELLPVEKQVVVEGEDDEEDPRWELIRQLVEYKKFKDAAAKLQYREEVQESVYARQPGKPDFTADEPPQKIVVSVFDLIGAVNNILKRYAAKEGESRDIFQDKWTVSEKIETILNTIESKGTVKFSELFDSAVSRTEVVVTFLAMLELIRLKRVLISQPETFADIEISKNEVTEATPTNLVTNIDGANPNNQAEAVTENAGEQAVATAESANEVQAEASSPVVESEPVTEAAPKEAS
ncbi:MAG TPA: segregation/condensation protein A [Verrucomicrobiae bacterium]